ncbi:HIRAN domain-containing protein [soil metagenome]
MNTLFVAWRSPSTQSWYTIGRLTFEAGVYRFAYTQGARDAQQRGGFTPLASFPQLEQIYESETLFPLFSNRLPSPSRPDYAEFIEWMSVPQDADDPVALLARSGGERATDQLEVYPRPELEADGLYHIHFFAHGLRYFPQASRERAERLTPGEQLRLMHDLQNEHDPNALLLRTAQQTPGDIHLVGYCPRYLAPDVLRLLRADTGSELQVAVERVNPPPAPVQFRLLCNMTLRWPDSEFQPFSSPAHQPIPAGADTAPVVA